MYGGDATLPDCLNWFDLQIFLYNVTVLDLKYFPDESWESVGSKCRFVIERFAIINNCIYTISMLQNQYTFKWKGMYILYNSIICGQTNNINDMRINE